MPSWSFAEKGELCCCRVDRYFTKPCDGSEYHQEQHLLWKVYWFAVSPGWLWLVRRV